MCERELETEQNCNILTPTLLAITAFLSRSPGLLNQGPGGLGAQPLWDMILTPASSLQLVWGLRAPSAGCWRSLPHLISNWSGLQTNWLPVFTELYNSSTPTFFLCASHLHSLNPSTVKVIILIFLDWMHLLFTEVHFLFWQPGRVVGQYTTHFLKLFSFESFSYQR